MGTSKNLFLQMACCGVFFCGMPGAVTASEAQQASGAQNISSVAANAGQTGSGDLPDSPGATTGAMTSRQPVQSGEIELAMNSPQGGQQGNQSSSQSQSQAQSSSAQQPTPQTPVGTAAAGSVPATGVAASQPAGVAIAPAKQHRVRTIVIRTGAIIGAAVAIGTVVALSEGTSSRPPH